MQLHTSVVLGHLYVWGIFINCRTRFSAHHAAAYPLRTRMRKGGTFLFYHQPERVDISNRSQERNGKHLDPVARILQLETEAIAVEVNGPPYPVKFTSADVIHYSGSVPIFGTIACRTQRHTVRVCW